MKLTKNYFESDVVRILFESAQNFETRVWQFEIPQNELKIDDENEWSIC